MLLSIQPREFFAVALPNAAFLHQPEPLVDAVGSFAVVSESDNGGPIFEWAWTDPHEGDLGELATWGSFARLSH